MKKYKYDYALIINVIHIIGKNNNGEKTYINLSNNLN